MTREQIEAEWNTWACTVLTTDKWELLFMFAQHIAKLERAAAEIGRTK